jgi:hypothetical protein
MLSVVVVLRGNAVDPGRLGRAGVGGLPDGCAPFGGPGGVSNRFRAMSVVVVSQFADPDRGRPPRWLRARGSCRRPYVPPFVRSREDGPRRYVAVVNWPGGSVACTTSAFSGSSSSAVDSCVSATRVAGRFPSCTTVIGRPRLPAGLHAVCAAPQIGHGPGSRRHGDQLIASPAFRPAGGGDKSLAPKPQ